MSAEWRQEAEELRRLAPKRFLFLCVANSARSQMAEGLGRALAFREVRDEIRRRFEVLFARPWGTSR